jgi:hypothetical protein
MLGFFQFTESSGYLNEDAETITGPDVEPAATQNDFH